MRRLTFVVAILALIYGGYWFAGSWAVERGARNALSDMSAQGWQVSYADLGTRGFPSRFDTSVTDLMLTRPDGAISWTVPFLQILALSYQPNRVIAAVADSQELRFGDQTLRITTDGLRASAGVAASTDLTLDTVTAEVGAAQVTSDFGWQAGLSEALVALRPTGDQSYQSYAEVSGIALPEALRMAMDPGRLYPETIDVLRVQALLDFSRPIDRHSLSGASELARITGLELTEFNLGWGIMTVRATGALVMDANGIPEGEIVVTAENWPDIVAVLRRSGAVLPGVADLIGNAASSISQGSATVEVPITFSGGLIQMGFVPLGPAPRF